MADESPRSPEEDWRLYRAGRHDKSDADLWRGVTMSLDEYMRIYPCTCTDEDAYCECGPPG